MIQLYILNNGATGGVDVEHEFIVDNIRRVISDAGDMMISGAEAEKQIAEKSSAKDLVTQYDKLIQEKIISGISGYLPDAQFVSEESATIGDIYAEDAFIVDPIDGTTNFIHSMGNCAVSVAWYKFGKPSYGAVYDPFAKEFYEAESGKGAFLNGKQIKVSDSSLKNSIVLFGTSPYNVELTDITFDLVRMIFGKCQDVRRMGSAALDICRVANGRAGLYFEAALSLWDYAAAVLILKESGGSMVDFMGREIILSTEKTSVVAGNCDTITESKIIERVKSTWTSK